ncbi:AcrR family transcriptional regulator [Mycolicibacterium sp. BK556]|uniref:TetR/AcrR family transcriptional regulator n=1 Tax=unclassified Mycolicibacterium TaxID=2636767 RepID=UPI0016228A34|nr:MULTISPECIES: TetR/AcrR family transcriptional regulator [unclassified Mycolicibacterium]MBB3602120.1 AcrR family transcriptional regulator [Mycolicibacterium sp. BK556]MBB3631872.1 AcrR family transcriptional regulator [Mycolicibacterium sp. BK607]
MARKGWGGSPPADDAEARKRIIDAALRLVDRRGAAQTTVLDIADELGITRRTVYRYFAGTDELFAAAAEAALGSFVTQIDRVVADLDVASQLIEVVAYIIERLPQEPQLALLLANDRSNMFSRAMLTADVIARCRTVLHHAQIDWDQLGFDDQMIDELLELLLRTIQSMVIAPLDPPRSGTELRAYLHRWLGPALAPRAATESAG